MNGSRKLYVKSFGCQMNVYDSRRMADTLAPQGYIETSAAADADLVILNTCHIREKAAEKVYSELGRVRRLKEAAAAEGRRLVIAVAGCVAQAEGEEIIRRAPAVDLVFGPQSYHRLPDLLARAERDGKAVDTEFPVDDKFDHLAAPSLCGNPCARRFRLRHRAGGLRQVLHVLRRALYARRGNFPARSTKILAEVERLAEAGVREVTLIGQNVNAYHGEGPDGRPWSLARLLDRVGEIDGIDRLRYTTSHPRDMDDDLIAAHRDLPKLMPQLHLPVQSGSDRILAAMNRRHTRADYVDIVARLRAARPDLALTSDFIVGFPGETEEDFAATLGLVGEIGFSGAFSFKYSPRPGTPGADMDDQVDEETKSDRLHRLQAAIDRNQAAFNRRCLGRTLDVLFERPGRYSGQLVGRSPYLQPVQVTAPAALIGEIAAVTITEIASNSLFGALAPLFTSPCKGEVGERSEPGAGLDVVQGSDPSRTAFGGSTLPFRGR